MGYIDDITALFGTAPTVINERVGVFDLRIAMNTQQLPLYNDLVSLTQSFPERDTVSVTIKNNDTDVSIALKDSNEQDYIQFQSYSEESDDISVHMIIDKSFDSNNVFSIYDFDAFSRDILELTIVDVLGAFMHLFSDNRSYIIFEIFSGDYLFTTKTMTFCNSAQIERKSNFSRNDRLQICRNVTPFCTLHRYPLLPDDFKIELDCAGNELACLFDSLTTLFSLAYISSSSSIEGGILTGCIEGQRNQDFSIDFNQKPSNLELYRIYDWIYTDGNPIDKAMIARNVMSLHCNFAPILATDERTLASIQSNFKLYLKDNVVQYLDLKNELAKYVCEVSARIGDYAMSLHGKFVSNIVAIFGFLFTVILSNIISENPLTNIFTRDITIILEVVFIGSLFYLYVCRHEAHFKFREACKAYDLLKGNYSSILAIEDISESFNNDNIINDMSHTVNNTLDKYTRLWSLLIIILFVLVEIVSESPPLITIIHSIMH